MHGDAFEHVGWHRLLKIWCLSKKEDMYSENHPSPRGLARRTFSLWVPFSVAGHLAPEP